MGDIWKILDSKWPTFHNSFYYYLYLTGQAGLEAVFQVPIPGDSGSSPNAGSISNYCLTQEIFHSNPSGIQFNRNMNNQTTSPIQME
jgi:hypothetical protein